MENLEQIIQNIKKDFFSYRNGIVANSLKGLYPSATIIFGLMVPQFMDLVAKYPKNLELALKLWSNKSDRESRLFALYIIPVEKVDFATAKSMAKDVRSIEEADFLSFKVLRNIPNANNLFEELSKENNPAPIYQYCLQMFKKNLDLSQ